MIHKETSKTIIVWKSLSWENNEKFPIVFFHIFFFFFSVWMANDDDDGETKAWGRRESEAETELSSVNSVNIETERDRQEQESVIISSLLIPVSSNDRKKMCHWEWRRNEIKTIINTDDDDDENEEESWICVQLTDIIHLENSHLKVFLGKNKFLTTSESFRKISENPAVNFITTLDISKTP